MYLILERFVCTKQELAPFDTNTKRGCPQLTTYNNKGLRFLVTSVEKGVYNTYSTKRPKQAFSEQNNVFPKFFSSFA